MYELSFRTKYKIINFMCQIIVCYKHITSMTIVCQLLSMLRIYMFKLCILVTVKKKKMENILSTLLYVEKVQ